VDTLLGRLEFQGGDLANTIPETMRVVAISEPGGPEVLRVEVRPVPQPGPGEVLVKVSHAGVNRPDCLQRQGLYAPPPDASDLPGLEIAGHVAAPGDGVVQLLVGQAICALTDGGGYAEYCLVPVDRCIPVPEGLTMAEAAAIPETLLTVWHNVFERGHARDGETLLVHGGTSGIGTMAIKLARLFGLKAIVTCGSEEKCAAALRIGASHAINYRQADFVEHVRDLTAGKGANVILDMVAGDYTQRNLMCLAEDGRLVTIAVLGGARAEINIARLMMKRHTLTGSTLRARSDDFKALLTGEILANVWPAVANGELRPEMDEVFALEEAAKAHARMESGEHIGKIVLAIS